MQVKNIQSALVFRPFILEITIESQKEKEILLRMLGYDITIPETIPLDRQDQVSLTAMMRQIREGIEKCL